MKYLLFFITSALYLSADIYTIKWEVNDQVEDYGMDVLCVDTGFSTFKRYSKTTASTDINLAPDQTYKIILFAASKDGGLVPSNTLIIKTSKPQSVPRLKAPKITATKRE